MDEAAFFSSFEEVPKITLYNAKNFDEIMNGIRECIQNANNAWDKRVDSVRIFYLYLIILYLSVNL